MGLAYPAGAATVSLAVIGACEITYLACKLNTDHTD